MKETRTTVKIADIKEGLNPRNVTEKSVKDTELAKSVAAHGVQTPVWVRKVNGSMTLLAGGRRIMAAKLAGHTEIPAIVFEDITDQQAFDKTFFENNAREDLDPIALVNAIQTLMKLHKGDKKTVASKLLVSESTVALCVQLQRRLAKPWFNALKKGKYDIPFENYVELSKLPKNLQSEVREYTLERLDRKDLAKRLRQDFMIQLKSAPWDVEKVCGKCQKRSDANPELFEDDGIHVAKNAQCLDEKCYRKHLVKGVTEKVQALKEKNPNILLVTGHDPEAEAAIIDAGVKKTVKYHDAYRLKPVKKGTEGACLVVSVEHGKLKTKWAAGKKTQATTTTAKPKVDKKAAHESKRWFEVNKMLEEALHKVTYKDLRKGITGARLALAFGMDYEYNSRNWNDTEPFNGLGAKLTDEQVDQAFFTQAIENVRSHNGHAFGKTQLKNEFIEHMKKLAWLFDIDITAMYVKACEMLPDPKSWSNDKAAKPTKKKAKAKKTTLKKGKVSSKKEPF